MTDQQLATTPHTHDPWHALSAVGDHCYDNGIVLSGQLPSSRHERHMTAMNTVELAQQYHGAARCRHDVIGGSY